MTFCRSAPARGLCALAFCFLFVIQTACWSDAADPPVAKPQAAAAPQVAGRSTRTRSAKNAPNNPFETRVPAPDFEGAVGWINTAGPIDLKDLKGKFVLLDFWTYCCINCMHILPELEKLEAKYPDQLVVIGVHSAKFETEKDSHNITDAVLRYNIRHPVVNDANMAIWRRYDVHSWPTMYLIDPEGDACYRRSGEFEAADIEAILDRAIPFYRKHGALDETPLRFELERYQAPATPLQYPGKLLADDPGGRLFIADSSHNRIVVAGPNGKLQFTIGTGEAGAKDGGFAEATFKNPQGMALHKETLYVADTDNHMIRKIDLTAKTVATIAGTGKQGRDQNNAPRVLVRGVGQPRQVGLNSPWDLLVHDNALFIAMAGPHQIWRMPLNESGITPFAGNGREDIVDGALLPPRPYALGFSSFAQPSGLASDGKSMYVADSEGSSIRIVPLVPRGAVSTLIGTSHLPGARLFTFGDIDGVGDEVRLQHPLCVAYGDGLVYVADTYNNKIKVIDVRTRSCKTLAGTGQPGAADNPPEFDEPAGISLAGRTLYIADTNNHLIRVLDLDSGEVSTLTIEGLSPPAAAPPEALPLKADVEVAVESKALQSKDDKLQIAVELKLPEGFKINPLAPLRYRVESLEKESILDSLLLAESTKIDPPSASFTAQLPLVKAEGADRLRITVNYYYCKEGAEGVCKAASVAWVAPVSVSSSAGDSQLALSHVVK